MFCSYYLLTFSREPANLKIFSVGELRKREKNGRKIYFGFAAWDNKRLK